MSDGIEALDELYTNSQPWRTDALCRKNDPDLFFPVGTTGPAIQQIELAKGICRQCIAQSDCLQYALERRIDHGIWGGTTEFERRRILQRRASLQAGRTATHYA